MEESNGMDYPVLEVWGSGGPSVLPLRIANPPPGFERKILTKQRLIYTSESRILQLCKNEINAHYQEGKWDDYKKITNPYEYIFLSWNRRTSRSVATRQPLSRSYFKMKELWYRLDLGTQLAPLVAMKGGLATAHAAEGPGGFIEACSVVAQESRWKVLSSSAITLRSDARNIPGWRKATKFLEDHLEVDIQTGADGTGNILLLTNQRSFVDSVRALHPDGVHLYTADGGFDFSSDYNAQEDSILPLFLAECLLGLQVLTKGGYLIVKCFDTTEKPTLDLLWLMSKAFCEWGLVKPRTSRAGNAERYFVAKGLPGDAGDILSILTTYQERGMFTHPILNMIDAVHWSPMMAKITSLQEQMEHLEILVIHETIELIRTTDPTAIRQHVSENVRRALDWCLEHREFVSSVWVTEFERNVSKETSDLLHILNPPGSVLSYNNSWNTRGHATNHITFEGFRTASVATDVAVDATDDE
jgi:hypothetical protein